MNYNKAGLVLLLFSVFGSFAWFAWLVFGRHPIDLGEITVATTESGSSSAISPLREKYWISHKDSVVRGTQVYRTYCAVCHGPKGLGDGAAGASLVPPPRNLVQGLWKKGGRSIQLYQTITQGMTGTSMASFSHLSKTDRWALVHYIRSITQNKIKDDIKKLEKFAKDVD